MIFYTKVIPLARFMDGVSSELLIFFYSLCRLMSWPCLCTRLALFLEERTGAKLSEGGSVVCISHGLPLLHSSSGITGAE